MIPIVVMESSGMRQRRTNHLIGVCHKHFAVHANERIRHNKRF